MLYMPSLAILSSLSLSLPPPPAQVLLKSFSWCVCTMAWSIAQVLRRFADGAMEPIPLTNLSFRPAKDGHMNPLLLPIQLPYILVDRIITRVENVLQLTMEDKVRIDFDWFLIGFDRF